MSGLDFRGTGGGGGTAGLTQVSNDAGRLALTPTDGTAVYQRDTKEEWIWTGGDYPTGAWSLFGSVDNIIYTADTNSIGLSLGTNAGVPRTAEPVTLTADLNLSAAAADAGNLKIPLDIQTDGLRAEIPVATDSADGYLSAADHTTLTDVRAQNSVDVTLTSIGAAPNNNGASLSGQQLQLQPADSTHGGVIANAAQDLPSTKSVAGGLRAGATGAPAASAAFDVVSTTKGSIPSPVMTSTQMLAISAPATGLMVYASDLKVEYFYNGTNWEPTRAYQVNSAQTIATGTALTPGQFRRQVVQLSGNGGAATVSDILATNALAGDELLIIGTSSVNIITLNTSTNTITNGTCTLGQDDVIGYTFINSKWRETYRSA